ncbi:MAG: glycosyltransferase [Gammaproteobacteria bacterium]
MTQAEGLQPRLLVLASTYPRWPGDPEPGFVHELAKRLTGDFDVTVLGPHAPGAPTRERMDGVDVVRYRYAPQRWETLVNDGGIVTNLRRQPWKWLLVPGFLLGLAWKAWRLVRELRPSVVHAHWLLPQGLVAAVLKSIEPRMPPFLVTSHGADLFALRAAPLQALKRWVARRAAGVTVVSGAMREELARIGVDPSTVQVMPMGVDLAGRFRPDPAVERSRDELLFVGRLVEKKGLRHLIDAMPAILRAHPTAFLTVAGFGPEEAQLREQARALGVAAQVRFLGPVRQEELPDLYRRAAVFVAPFVAGSSGDQEGLGLVLVEAAGCGCPVVAGDVPAVRDVVVDRRVGIRVPPGDAASLAFAVCAELAGQGEQCDTERANAVQAFDWRASAGNYLKLLRSGIQGHQG